MRLSEEHGMKRSHWSRLGRLLAVGLAPILAVATVVATMAGLFIGFNVLFTILITTGAAAWLPAALVGLLVLWAANEVRRRQGQDRSHLSRGVPRRKGDKYTRR